MPIGIGLEQSWLLLPLALELANEAIEISFICEHCYVLGNLRIIKFL